MHCSKPNVKRGEEMTLRRGVSSVHGIRGRRGRSIHGVAKVAMSEEEVKGPSHISTREQVRRGRRIPPFDDGVGDLGMMLFAVCGRICLPPGLSISPFTFFDEKRGGMRGGGRKEGSR